MAVTAETLIQALRLGDTTEERAIAERLLAAAQEIVDREAGRAPDVLQDEAVIRLVGYWFDMPQAARGAGFANAFRNSGAQAIVAPYRPVRARVTP